MKKFLMRHRRAGNCPSRGLLRRYIGTNRGSYRSAGWYSYASSRPGVDGWERSRAWKHGHCVCVLPFHRLR